ncbi:MAG: hypothetical protein M1383_03370 [Patescibacteria group bacterium]|nr:hypothetical protein [Patescibacteria group bacterium]
MPEEFQNLNILISGIEDTGPQIKIRDQNKRTYSFFKHKKDGGETVAFQTYKNFKIGDTAEISFKDVPYKEGTIRNIIAIRPATGEPQAALPRAGGAGMRPGREYWEKREATRQSSILFQVAFKAAVALQAARIRTGLEENRDQLYDTALEFYDWMAAHIGEEPEHGGHGRRDQPEEDEILEA